MIDDLRRLRQRVLERLDALEALARRHEACAVANGGIAERERMVRQMEAGLDEAHRRLEAEAARQEMLWGEATAQLDADRRRLAEAWERIEQERIEGHGSPAGHATPQARLHATPGGTPAALVHTVAAGQSSSARANPEPNNPVAQAILRQFEVLARDVRSRAESCRDPL